VVAADLKGMRTGIAAGSGGAVEEPEAAWGRRLPERLAWSPAVMPSACQMVAMRVGGCEKEKAPVIVDECPNAEPWAKEPAV